MHCCMGVSLLIELEDATERNGRRVATPTPSHCSRTDETGHWPAFRNKQVNTDFAKRALFVPLVGNAKKLLLRISLLFDYLHEKE